MTYDPTLEDEADRIVRELEEAVDELTPLRTQAARSAAEAKRVEALALLSARDQGYRSREERAAYATIESSEQAEVADICERHYRDKLTYVRVLQSQLELIRTRMVTNRDLRV